ncbi:MAG: type II toxin-antitoxin system YafQ family toxin [Candidatus Spyradenecus sp.]
MIYRVLLTAKFKRDYKRLLKRGIDEARFQTVVSLLACGESLPPSYRDHALSGDYAGFRECHIKPDWLLIYKQEADKLILTLTRTGSHSDLF